MHRRLTLSLAIAIGVGLLVASSFTSAPTARCSAIAAATIQLCRDLGLEVTAEGIERPAQFAALMRHQPTVAAGVSHRPPGGPGGGAGPGGTHAADRREPGARGRRHGGHRKSCNPLSFRAPTIKIAGRSLWGGFMRRAFTFMFIGLAGLFLANVALAATAQQGSAARCQQLAGAGRIAEAQVQQAQHVDANPTTGTPAYCELTAQTSSVPGSHITLVYRLPDNWNGRMLGLGGGGWAGNITLATATDGLKRGFATAQTDGGHVSASGVDTAWMKGNPVALTDFSYRAVHLMTSLGKQVVEHYYGDAPSHSYFQGCSTGGRMGLMEAQRYPAGL